MANELVGRASDRCRWRSDPLRAATGGSGMALEEKASHQVATKCAD